jgi:nitroreductase
MDFNISQINHLIRSRRSVFPKDYTGEKVSHEVIAQILENARWAPSHKLTEPWRFVVFSGDGLRKLAEFQAGCYKEVTEKDNTFKEEKYQALLTKPIRSSHIIAVGMKRDEKKSVPEVEELGAVFCAIENMYLTSAAYGVGAYLSTGGVTYYEEAKAFFGLNQEDRLIGFFHVGIPNRTVDSKRKSLDEKVKWVE